MKFFPCKTTGLLILSQGKKSFKPIDCVATKQPASRFHKFKICLSSSVVMEISYVWNDQIPEKDGSKVPVNDMAFSPGNSPHCYASQNLYDAIK